MKKLLFCNILALFLIIPTLCWADGPPPPPPLPETHVDGEGQGIALFPHGNPDTGGLGSGFVGGGGEGDGICFPGIEINFFTTATGDNNEGPNSADSNTDVFGRFGIKTENTTNSSGNILASIIQGNWAKTGDDENFGVGGGNSGAEADISASRPGDILLFVVGGGNGNTDVYAATSPTSNEACATNEEKSFIFASPTFNPDNDFGISGLSMAATGVEIGDTEDKYAGAGTIGQARYSKQGVPLAVGSAITDTWSRVTLESDRTTSQGHILAGAKACGGNICDLLPFPEPPSAPTCGGDGQQPCP